MDQMRQIFPRYEIRPLKDFLSLMSSTSFARARYFYRKHDCTRGFNRLPGDPAFHVHDRDRANAGHWRPEIHGRVEGLHHPGSAWRIGPYLCDWHCCRYRDELPHAGVFLSAFPTLSILITAGWVLRSAVIAVVGGLLGASYRAWLASRKDAIESPFVRLTRMPQISLANVDSDRKPCWRIIICKNHT